MLATKFHTHTEQRARARAHTHTHTHTQNTHVRVRTRNVLDEGVVELWGYKFVFLMRVAKIVSSLLR